MQSAATRAGAGEAGDRRAPRERARAIADRLARGTVPRRAGAARAGLLTPHSSAQPRPLATPAARPRRIQPCHGRGPARPGPAPPGPIPPGAVAASGGHAAAAAGGGGGGGARLSAAAPRPHDLLPPAPRPRRPPAGRLVRLAFAHPPRYATPRNSRRRDRSNRRRAVAASWSGRGRAAFSRRPCRAAASDVMRVSSRGTCRRGVCGPM